MPPTTVKALFFDVFGTLVDWRSGVAREAERLLSTQGVDLDWLGFADAWRAEYQIGMEEVRSGRIPFSPLDMLHRRNLDRILPRFGLEYLGEGMRDELNLAWHRLDAWPDVPLAMARLRGRFLIAPVSNGNIALQVPLARRNGFHWDAVLGAEIAGDYKPKPRVYLACAESLALPPEACMMVAAHSDDLAAGRRLRPTHRPYRAPGRMRPRPRRKRAGRAGWHCGRRSSRPRRGALCLEHRAQKCERFCAEAMLLLFEYRASFPLLGDLT